MSPVTISQVRGGAFAGSTFGVIMVMTYNLLSASKEVVSGSLVQSLDPIALTAAVFAIVVVAFQLLAAGRGRDVYTAPLAHPGLLLRLNVFTCGAWIGFFYSVAFLEPAVVSALMVGLGPALATILVPFWYGGTVGRSEAVGAFGILLSASYIAWLAATGGSSLGSIGASDLMHGGLSTLLGSVAMIGSSIYSKHLSNIGAEPVGIMAHRFYLLLAVSFAVLVLTGTSVAPLISRGATILGLAMLGVVIPLWALQVGIRNLKPLSVMILISTAPAFTYAIQLLDPRLEEKPAILVGVAALCASAIVSQISWPRRRTERSDVTPASGTS